MNGNNITSAAPNGIPAHGRWLIIYLLQHRIMVCSEGKIVREFDHFSVGRKHHETPLIRDGEILPYKRLRHHRSSSWPRPHGGAPMPFSLFFTETQAFHGGYVDIESHGCVHLQLKDAEWLFNWVGNNKVQVRFVGPYSHQHSSPQLTPKQWLA